MDLGEVLVFLLLAMGDIVLLTFLRRMRRRRERENRISRSLKLAIARQNSVRLKPAAQRWAFVRRVSQFS